MTLHPGDIALAAIAERNRLRVIAGREGHHTALRVGGRQTRERVIGSAKLERATALEVLALEEEMRAGAVVDQARGGHRRAMRDAGDLRRRALDVSGRGPRCHLWCPASAGPTGACLRAARTLFGSRSAPAISPASTTRTRPSSPA